MQAFIPVDIQDGFNDWGHWGGARNNPTFEDNVARLLAHARSGGDRIIHVKHNSTEAHSPLHPSHPGNQIMAIAAPLAGETVIEKNVNSGFIGTTLEPLLREASVSDLVIFGITTDQCVSTTTRMAANLGFGVRLVGDACATFPKILPDGRVFDAQTIHDANLASLHNEFAQIVTTDNILA